jgi:DNA replication protein DnaC
MSPLTTAASLRDRIRAQLADLKMPGSLEALDDILRQADSGTLGAGPAVEQVLGAQIALRNARRLQTATRASRLPAIKTLADFDFSFQPSVKREQIESLHTLGFIERRENVVFLGPPGVGKSHLALSLAVAAVEAGRRVYFSTLADLIASLEEAQAQGRLAHRIRTLVFPSLMLIDEIGYLPITRTGAMLFFQVMSRRYEHAATILTSNKGFEEWGEVFGDEVMAAALIDRLVHHCHIVNIRGNSYRMRKNTDLYRLLHAERDRPAPETRNRRPTRSEGAPT